MRGKAPVLKSKLQSKNVEHAISPTSTLNFYQSVLFNKLLSVLEGYPDPGGCYKGGIWCRDAAHIIEALAYCGMHDNAKKWVQFIWSNIISKESRKIVFGRGSPIHALTGRQATGEFVSFSGALPTTIYSEHNEVYAAEPDIDSTALMIHATDIVYKVTGDMPFLLRAMPYVERAIHYLETRDSDGDLLVEQGQNEDWMDVICRSGKIVYSQATWIRSLKAYSDMLGAVGLASAAEDFAKKASKVVRKIDETMWDESHNCYFDIITCGDIQTQKFLTQDICYLLSLDEIDDKKRAVSLSTIQSRLSRKCGRAVIDPVNDRTTPIVAREYWYQNGGFWPWITAMECNALSKAGKLSEAVQLISQSMPYVEHEWVDPITGVGNGATPFKTGIAAMYIACENARRNGGMSDQIR